MFQNENKGQVTRPTRLLPCGEDKRICTLFEETFDVNA
jgi:hypothetical protein